MRSILKSFLIFLFLCPSAWAVTDFQVTVCSSGCDYTAWSTAEAAIDDVADIRDTSNLALTGAWDNQTGSNIADATAVTWDSGSRSGTLIHQTSSTYLIKCTTTTDCTNLNDNDTVTDGTNTFDIMGTPDSPAIVFSCGANETINDSVTISGITTDSDNKVTMTVPSAYRHDGTATTGCRINTTSGFAVVISNNYTTIEWMLISESVNSGSNLSCVSTATSASGVTDKILRNNIVIDCNNSGAGVYTGVVIGGANAASDNNAVLNNIIYGSESDGLQVNLVAAGNDIDIYNNTIVDSGGNGLSAGSAGNVDCQNNLIFGSTTNDNNGSCDTSATNATEDLTGEITGVPSSDFSNYAGDDYHLASGATDVIDQGTDLVTSQGVNFDIDNYNRDAGGVTWDIGADEFIAVAGGGSAGTGQGSIYTGMTLRGMTLK